MRSEKQNSDIKESGKKNIPISIEYMGKIVELGFEWEEVCSTLNSYFAFDLELGSALKLCLMEQLKEKIQISEEQKK